MTTLSTLTALLQDRVAQALAGTLVHFIWQGTVLALVAGLMMRWLAPTASSRYIVGVSALALMAEAPVVTFVLLLRASAMPAWLPPADLDTSHILLAASASAQPTWLMPVVLGAWSVGVVVLSVRLLGGWLVARRLVVRAVEPVSAEIHTIAQRVADRLRLRHLARIVESSAVSVPVVIGWMKPVVLLPAAALSGLTLAQVESLLAHELAHVRRHDYLINLLQAAVETLLFYHPAVWWLSKRIRTEREHCCDDIAVSMCDRVVYVSALTDMATLSIAGAPRLALAATDGPLLSRVRRILGGTEPVRPASGWVAIGALLLVIAGLTPVAMASARVEAQAATSGSAPVVEATQVYPARPVVTSADDARRLLAEAEEQVARLNAERDVIERLRADKHLTLKLEQARRTVEALEQDAVKAKVMAQKGLLKEGDQKDIEAQLDARLAAAREEYQTLMIDRDYQLSMTELSRRQREATVQASRARDDFEREAQRANQMETDVRIPMNFTIANSVADIGRAEAFVPGTMRAEQAPVLPKVVKSVRPEYTKAAKDAGIQGSVSLNVTVKQDGTVGAVSVTKGLDAGLDESAVKAARQWTFQPATLNGKSIDYDVVLLMTFTLK